MTAQERDFLAFAASVLGVDASRLTLETAYEALPEFDSVAHLRLVLEVEARYGVSIPLERIASLLTLRDFFALT